MVSSEGLATLGMKILLCGSDLYLSPYNFKLYKSSQPLFMPLGSSQYSTMFHNNQVNKPLSFQDASLKRSCKESHQNHDKIQWLHLISTRLPLYYWLNLWQPHQIRLHFWSIFFSTKDYSLLPWHTLFRTEFYASFKTLLHSCKPLTLACVLKESLVSAPNPPFIVRWTLHDRYFHRGSVECKRAAIFSISSYWSSPPTTHHPPPPPPPLCFLMW